VDLTRAATPGFFVTMAIEQAWLKRQAAHRPPAAGDYERRDTLTSLTMGTASVLAPFVAERLLGPLTPGRGRLGRALVAGAVGAAVVTTVADRVRRRGRARSTSAGTTSAAADGTPEPRTTALADRVARIGGVAAVATGGVALGLVWNDRTRPEALWRRRRLPDLGRGPLALALAVLGWDFVYYWNHRWMHTSRQAWAYHVVHHSSERYNLSTALRQPVAGPITVFVPYGLMALLGLRPEVIEQARGINLLYQYWIHTETIRRLGRAERVWNTPSHHRVHHGSNPRYLDRNHGSILIVWDRWFGTFAEEDAAEPVVYGLTKNLDSFDPVVVAGREYAAMLRDVAAAPDWRSRLAFVLRGPGWADRHRPVPEGVGAAA
jgi:sterol desaturase/sphingolipid hydroxylase (fatty acid hydroxylase superfamily)